MLMLLLFLNNFYIVDLSVGYSVTKVCFLHLSMSMHGLVVVVVTED